MILVIWPPHPILGAIRELLSHPIVLIQTILFNIYGKALIIYRMASAGQELSAGTIFSLIRWILLAIFIFALIVLVCVNTVKRVMFAESKERNLFFDAVLTFLVLFLYYLGISVVFYIFLNFVLPIVRIL